jgi:hypothetical protein
MYKCKNSECSNTTLYSDKFIAGTNADGSPSNTCKACDTLLSQTEREVKTTSASINTRGCAPTSNPYTH